MVDLPYAQMVAVHARQWCWACGRKPNEPPTGWGGPWLIERAHLAAGSGAMRRVHDSRAVNLLCSRCHRCHRHRSGDMVSVNGKYYPRLTNGDMLWLKRERCSLDVEFVKSIWIGVFPELTEPDDWYMRQYQMRHPWDHLENGGVQFVRV